MERVEAPAQQKAMKMLGRFGWQAAGGSKGGAPVVFDGLLRSEFGMARMWSPSVNLDMDAASERLFIGVLVEGACEFGRASGSRWIEPGELLMSHGGSGLHLTASTPVSIYGWYVKPRLLASPALRRVYDEPIRVVPGLVQMLTSTTNSILNDRGGHTRRGDYHALIEHMLIAVLLERRRSGSSASSGRAETLLDHAQALIERRFSDPEFDVGIMVQVLRTSRTSLTRAYRELGTTPVREIALRRLREVAYVRDSQLGHAGAPSAALATACGFRSARHLRDTLRRYPSV